MTKQLPRGVRNNNPGNVERTTDRWLGMSADQSSDSRFVIFDTPEAGLRCLMRVLINYQERHSLNTVRGVIERWAHPSENNTSAYIQRVSRLTGFAPDEQLDFLDRSVCTAFARAIVLHECGDPRTYGRGAEWYDAATWDRAAVMAGFAPEVNPLMRSRTLAGAGIAAVATLAGLGAEPLLSSEELASLGTALGALGAGSVAQYLSPVTALAGIAWAVYARVSDSRRKLR